MNINVVVKQSFIISLVIAIIEIAVVALGIKLTMTYSGNLSKSFNVVS